MQRTLFFLMLGLLPAVNHDTGGNSDQRRNCSEKSGHKVASCLFLGFS
jgi:hypothetical protein